jgi:hypothetical protein
MTRADIAKYEEPEALKAILQRTLAGLKFRLDCGHHITFNAVLGNDLIIRNSKRLTITCSQCGY